MPGDPTPYLQEMAQYWQNPSYCKKLSCDRYLRHAEQEKPTVMSKIGKIKVPKKPVNSNPITNPDSATIPYKLMMNKDHFKPSNVLTAPNSDFDTHTYAQKECIPASKQVQTKNTKRRHVDIFKTRPDEDTMHTITMQGSFPKCSEGFNKVQSYKPQVQQWFVSALNIESENLDVEFFNKNGNIGMTVRAQYRNDTEATKGKWTLADKQLEVNLRNFIRATIRDTIFFKVNIVEGGPSRGEFEHTRCGGANKFTRTNIFVPLDENNGDDSQYERALRLRPTPVKTVLGGMNAPIRPKRKQKKKTKKVAQARFKRKMFPGKSYRQTSLMLEPSDPKNHADHPNAFVGVTVTQTENITGNICPKKGMTIDERRVQIAESLAPAVNAAIDKKKWKVVQQNRFEDGSLVKVDQSSLIQGSLKDRKGITQSYPKRLAAKTTEKFFAVAPFATYKCVSSGSM